MVDRERRCESINGIDIGPGDLLEELSGVGRQAIDVLSLALGEERVERERAFPAARNAGDDGHRVAPNIDIDRLQIVNAGSPDSDCTFVHRSLPGSWTGSLGALFSSGCRNGQGEIRVGEPPVCG